jgi:molecular chaperone DnaK
MSTEVTISSLIPELRDKGYSNPFNTTFVGIDFGTSTTVVSVAKIGESAPIQTFALNINQIIPPHNAEYSSDKVPSVIAWYNDTLYVGKGAADLKYNLLEGKNIWFSFKMKLGEDLGNQYYKSDLNEKTQYTILTPKDAAKVFFQHLKSEIDDYIANNNLSRNIKYAVSIPASFEANQRKDLIEVLKFAGIYVDNQCLIDEPNAAFLSYIVETNTNPNNTKLFVPENDSLHILVFDFGAGTCDISILEIENNLGLKSKNLSISRFEKLGGDDIDRLIAYKVLLPQLYHENAISDKELKTPDITKRVIPKLLKAAEELKIAICKSVSGESVNSTLPKVAGSSDFLIIGNPINISLPKRKLILTQPKMSYQQFKEVMSTFLNLNNKKVSFQDEDDFISIFNPIKSALKKAELTKDEIDYVLIIGGSAKNPYIQHALIEYFNESEMIIPYDLQTHVSAGAAIHSLLFNGFGKNVIQPITSEPIMIVTKNFQMRTLVKEGTPIPCEKFIIDDLVPQREGQKTLEIPFCVSDTTKILQIITFDSPSSEGFRYNAPIKVECYITPDKLLHISATVNNQTVKVNPVNPYANRSLRTEERMVKEAEKQFNDATYKNGGKPTYQAAMNLHEAYIKANNPLRAAETLESVHEMFPNKTDLNDIGFYYGKAGYKEKEIEYYEKNLEIKPTPIAAFNLALTIQYKDKNRYEKLMEVSLQMDSEYPYSLHYYGEYLMNKGESRGKEMVQKAFDVFKRRFDNGNLEKVDYHRLEDCANIIGNREFALVVRQREKEFPSYEKDLINKGNLVASKENNSLSKN